MGFFAKKQTITFKSKFYKLKWGGINFITFSLILISLSLLPLFGLTDAPNLTKLREIFLSICYLVLIVLLWKNKYTRVLSILLIFLWITNLSISILIYQLFSSHLNNELAITVLSTNFNEATDFIYHYWYILIIGLSLFTIISFIAMRLSSCLSTKKLKILPLILLLTVSYKFGESVFKGRLNVPQFNMLEKVLPYASLNNLGIFSRAYQELNILKAVSGADIPNYQLKIDNSHINTYVIVIGESVRRDHVSLYGYTRQTTPYIEEQKDNLFIFNQAIASAPVTTMSLASALTIKPPIDNTFELLGDNIINLANQSGFNTYWFSRQVKIGGFETVVTSIAGFSQHKEWLNKGYDDVLLSKLDEALKEDSNNKKKLIILHTEGSHLSACNKYPHKEIYFVDGQSEYIDCYDNSIRFTDKLMKQIFNRLEHKSASVLYFSDHGQAKRIKRNGKIDYVHGAINPSKESVDVPLFIWFSPFINNTYKKIGSYQPLYSMTNNYSLIANWLGISEINGQKVSSPLLDSYIPQDKIIVVDTKLNVFDYQTLQSESGSIKR